jgi:hypothetical protein
VPALQRAGDAEARARALRKEVDACRRDSGFDARNKVLKSLCSHSHVLVFSCRVWSVVA